MGIDYDGVGGIGIKVTDEIITELIESGKFTEEEFQDDPYGCFDEIGLSYSCAGNEYSGNTWFYFLVRGENLDEINNNKENFIDSLNALGIVIQTKDLVVISDIFIY